VVVLDAVEARRNWQEWQLQLVDENKTRFVARVLKYFEC
jgi:hypothetical protein